MWLLGKEKVMVTKADRYTINTKQQELYSDFTMNFDLNPITGFLSKVTNEDSIKQALKCLLLTKRTERFYDSYAGSRLNSLLFEPIDSVTENSIRSEIQETIQNNEPRVTNVDIKIKADQNINSYTVTIFFEVINIPDKQFDLTIVLKRVH